MPARLALGDLPGARADLVVALRLLPPGSDEAREVEADLARVEAARGQE
ncbi:MAG: hypothetical protein KF878_21310 [Planctomycetes bacterium]|nr:hypothetical protein [Planctomycetota bacterium]